MLGAGFKASAGIIWIFAAAVTEMPKLLDRVRQATRRWHDGPQIEDAYVPWIRGLVLFRGMRYPLEMGEPEVVAFLGDLAVHDDMAASNQDQAVLPNCSSAGAVSLAVRAAERRRARGGLLLTPLAASPPGRASRPGHPGTGGRGPGGAGDAPRGKTSGRASSDAAAWRSPCSGRR
jgi:hypothetical protein